MLSEGDECATCIKDRIEKLQEQVDKLMREIRAAQIELGQRQDFEG
jgi:hypothetical protein